MAKVRIRAVLWRDANASTMQSLSGHRVRDGKRPGKTKLAQIDVRLNRQSEAHDVARFFDVTNRELINLNQTTGSYDIMVEIAAFDGPNPVPPYRLKLHQMGPKASRHHEWYISKQTPTNAHPLWRMERAFPEGVTKKARPGEYVLVVRDEHDGFHARWLTADDLAKLPPTLRQAIEGSDCGIHWENDMSSDTKDSPQHLTELLLKHHNVLLQGPPGTGKSYLMQMVRERFEDPAMWLDTAKEHDAIGGVDKPLVRWVTFHQAFGYEDFVVGLRPEPGSDKALSLVATPGVLLELTEHARRPGCASLLLVDEINRGNVSRILGELITLMEGTKRDGAVETKLPFVTHEQPLKVVLDDDPDHPVPVPNPFSLPSRFYLLASMNSVDKSVAPLDSAIRRRFHVERLMPDLTAMAEHFGLEGWSPDSALPPALEEPGAIKQLALALLFQLNRGIAHCLGPEFQLGQWYLEPLTKAEDADGARTALLDVWRSRLLPQLEELFQGRGDQLAALLGFDKPTRTASASSPLNWMKPPAALEAKGAMPLLQRQDVGDEATLSFLRGIVEPKST